MEWIFYLVAVLFFIAAGLCVLTVAVGLPGVWMIIGLAVGIEIVDTLYLGSGSQTFSWWLIGAAIIVGGFGEILEFTAGMLGAKTTGSSKRGMWGALLGGLIGAVAGIAIPIPIVGSLIGAVIGTFVGAVVGEISGQDVKLHHTIKPATGATIGRILGTLAKVPIAAAVWLALGVDAFVR